MSTYALPAKGAMTNNEALGRAVVASTIGTVIEWFDYALYGAAAGIIINKLFFPQLSATAGVLASFATFAVGFFARPLGGIVIAHLGDRFGRKPALIFTISLMGLSTVVMGLLPTFAQVGVLAPVLLVFFRLVQGFGAGAEFAGAVTLVAEYAPAARKAFYTAFIQSATVLGIMIATLCFLLVSYLPEEVLFGWAWRVPFLVSALLFIVAVYIRKRLDETPEYVQAMAKHGEQRRKESVPLGELLRKSPKEVLFGFLSVTGHNANAYILSAFCLSYMTNTLHMARTDALTAVIVSSFVGVLLTPFLGMLADRIGHSKVYIIGAAFMLAFAFPLFALLDTKNVVLCSIAMSLGYGIGFGGMASAQCAFLANLFPTRYRFSGIALSRELSGLLIAGPTPFIASALVAAATGASTYVSVYLMVCCAITILAVLAIQSRSYDRGAE